mgnify:CR=1 FL=1
MAKTKKEKKEKKAGKRMKKKELVKALLDFFHIKQDEVLSLKYIFEQLHLTTHPLKMLCMDILSELSDDDYITEVDKHKYKLNNHGVEEELIAIPFVRWVQYWDSYLDILILNRLLIRLNVMVADFVLVIASLPALIPKHMRLIIPVVLLVWIV